MQKNPHDELYTAWKADPNKDSLFAVVKALEPSRKHVLASIGDGNDPYLDAKSKTLTAKAITTYDPAFGASLPTWVSRQLLPLRRLKRKSNAVVAMPESVQIDSYALMLAEKDFQDRHNREPDLNELSDATNLSIKRIGKVRNTFKKMPMEASFGEESAGLPGATVDYHDEALDYVYMDLDHIDKKIMEMKVGYGGAKIMDGASIAAKLKLSPSQVSRRSAKLAMKLNEMERSLADL